MSTPSIEVSIQRTNGKIDEEATLETARTLLKQIAADESAATSKVKSTVDAFMASPDVKQHKKISPKTFAVMAVTAMGGIPTPDRLERFEESARQLLASDDRFLNVKAGRNAGFHVKANYKAEELKALLPKSE